jgi:hypothetical protein
MSALSDQVLQVATPYLGPTAKMFMERQTTSHMNGLAFDNLAKLHLPDLANWVKFSAGLLIDKVRAEELANKIAKL